MAAQWRVLVSSIFLIAVMGCDGKFDLVQPSKDIYFLVDVSKSYATYSERSVTRLRSILGSIKPRDRITVAKIQSCSYSDESVILPTRSISDNEEYAYRDIGKLGQELKSLQGTLTSTSNTDIKGALIMASQHFRRSRSKQKLLVIFSDLRDDPEPGCANQPEKLVELAGVIIVFADVSISKPDEANAAGRLERINMWRDLAVRRGAQRVDQVQGVFEVQAILDELSGGQ